MRSDRPRVATAPSVDTVGRYLRVLASGEGSGLVEVRYRTPRGGMSQAFYPVKRHLNAARAIVALARRDDVYVGVLPRRARSGGREAVTGGRVVWVDCDSPEATAALGELALAPTMVVASGTKGHTHAYWRLERFAGAGEIELANRRLAGALGGCRASVDAARILRAPATLNFKHMPPRPVTLTSLNLDAVYRLEDLVGGLHDPAASVVAARRAGARAFRSQLDASLRAIAPADYVVRLAGLEPDRAGKVACPFHDDRTPSLQLYPEDWFCFGCRRGGSIYDFAGLLWGISPRGRGIWLLRERLAGRFGLNDRG